jgi:hypothetical protein
MLPSTSLSFGRQRFFERKLHNAIASARARFESKEEA